MQFYDDIDISGTLTVNGTPIDPSGGGGGIVNNLGENKNIIINGKMWGTEQVHSDFYYKYMKNLQYNDVVYKNYIYRISGKTIIRINYNFTTTVVANFNSNPSKNYVQYNSIIDFAVTDNRICAHFAFTVSSGQKVYQPNYCIYNMSNGTYTTMYESESYSSASIWRVISDGSNFFKVDNQSNYLLIYMMYSNSSSSLYINLQTPNYYFNKTCKNMISNGRGYTYFYYKDTTNNVYKIMYFYGNYSLNTVYTSSDNTIPVDNFFIMDGNIYTYVLSGGVMSIYILSNGSFNLVGSYSGASYSDLSYGMCSLDEDYYYTIYDKKVIKKDFSSIEYPIENRNVITLYGNCSCPYNGYLYCMDASKSNTSITKIDLNSNFMNTTYIASSPITFYSSFSSISNQNYTINRRCSCVYDNKLYFTCYDNSRGYILANIDENDTITIVCNIGYQPISLFTYNDKIYLTALNTSTIFELSSNSLVSSDLSPRPCSSYYHNVVYYKNELHLFINAYNALEIMMNFYHYKYDIDEGWIRLNDFSFSIENAIAHSNCEFLVYNEKMYFISSPAWKSSTSYSSGDLIGVKNTIKIFEYIDNVDSFILNDMTQSNLGFDSSYITAGKNPIYIHSFIYNNEIYSFVDNYTSSSPYHSNGGLIKLAPTQQKVRRISDNMIILET